jgi:hypothetical protein
MLGKESWKPAWILENRTAEFIGPGIGATFGAKKYLWGNIPAFDILKLGSNEGEKYAGDLRLLFAGTFFMLVKYGESLELKHFFINSLRRHSPCYQDGRPRSEQLRPLSRSYNK